MNYKLIIKNLNMPLPAGQPLSVEDFQVEITDLDLKDVTNLTKTIPSVIRNIKDSLDSAPADEETEAEDTPPISYMYDDMKFFKPMITGGQLREELSKFTGVHVNNIHISPDDDLVDDNPYTSSTARIRMYDMDDEEIIIYVHESQDRIMIEDKVCGSMMILTVPCFIEAENDNDFRLASAFFKDEVEFTDDDEDTVDYFSHNKKTGLQLRTRLSEITGTKMDDISILSGHYTSPRLLLTTPSGKFVIIVHETQHHVIDDSFVLFKDFHNNMIFEAYSHVVYDAVESLFKHNIDMDAAVFSLATVFNCGKYNFKDRRTFDYSSSIQMISPHIGYPVTLLLHNDPKAISNGDLILLKLADRVYVSACSTSEYTPLKDYLTEGDPEHD